MINILIYDINRPHLDMNNLINLNNYKQLLDKVNFEMTSAFKDVKKLFADDIV